MPSDIQRLLDEILTAPVPQDLSYSVFTMQGERVVGILPSAYGNGPVAITRFPEGTAYLRVPEDERWIAVPDLDASRPLLRVFVQLLDLRREELDRPALQAEA